MAEWANSPTLTGVG